MEKSFQIHFQKRSNMLDYILELIYPTKCGICGKICKDAICKKCEIKLKKYEINLTVKNNNCYCERMNLFKYECIIRKNNFK